MRVSRATAVVVQRVPASAVDWFLEWQRDTTLAAETFSGYVSSEVFPPREGAGDEWVTLIHFEDEPALKRWLESPERAGCVETLRQRVGEFKLETIGDGFGAWFTSQSRDAAAPPPPGWKMALTVVLGLYPTVMLLSMTVGLVTNRWGLALSMLIGNMCSVSILQWGVMPLLTRLLKPWLRANDAAQPRLMLGGLIVVLLALAVMTAVFRLITG
jgi:antibiotic biosynthesis monooxygenase (ABM) superfamily enzyme